MTERRPPTIDPILLDPNSYKNILTFILSEKFLTITAIGSIFTFAIISSLKVDVVDPLMQFLFPDEYFNFMDLTIRKGVKIEQPSPKHVELKLGDFFREFIVWLFAMCILYLLAKHTRFPDLPGGNSKGEAFVGLVPSRS